MLYSPDFFTLKIHYISVIIRRHGIVTKYDVQAPQGKWGTQNENMNTLAGKHIP